MSTGIQHATNQSIQPFGSSEEYLYAMKEDLAEWLRDLYDIEIDVNNLFETLETGDVLCSHANNVTRVAGEFIEKFGTGLQVQLPTKGVTFVRSAQPATFLARDNVSNFINWCRMQMNIKDVLMFETDDLVLRKNEKNFVLCLLEVARRASRFGMAAPVLIQLEQEIEEEIEQEIQEELAKPPVDTPLPAKPQRRASNTQNLDEMVQHLISHCTCPAQFPMVKLSEGKYRVGDSSALIFVRILRNHVMVRVGGGWDTLEHYLDKHDPCRCTSVSHKLSQRAATPVHEIRGRLRPRPDGAGQTQQPAMLVLSRRAHPPPRPVLWTPSAPLSSTARGLASARAPRTADPRSRTPEPGPRDPRTPGRYTSSSLSPDPGPRDRLHTADPGPRDRLHTADPGPRSARELKAPSPSRLRQSTSTPTLQHPQSEKDYPACNSSTRTGREAKRSSRVPSLTSSLPRPIQRSSTPQPQSQPQPQPQRSKTPLVFHRTENRLTQTWTKSQFVSKLRQSSNSTESGGFSTSQMQGGPVTPRPVTPRPVTPRPVTPRPVTPRPVTPVRGYSPARYTPACTRPASVGIREPEDDRVPQRSPNFIRTFCPAKKSWDIASGEAPVTPFTPIGGNLRGVQNKTPTPGGITANPSRACSNVNTDCRNPHGLSRQRAFGGPSDKTSTNSEVRGSFDELDFPDLPKLSGKGSGTGDGDSVTGYLFVPPPPISPAEEASLYRSLEHEILANLQQLSVDSGDDSDSNVPEDNSQNGLHDLRPKAPEQTCGEFQVESDRSKPRSLSQKQASSTDSMSVSRQSEASFDLVIGELSGGKSQLEKLCVESWVNTLPSTARSSDVASGSTVVHTGLNPSVISSWSSLGSSHQSIEQPAGPPDSGNRTSVSVSHRSTATNSTSVNLRADSADPENLMRLKPASFRQRRTLKKPERIPSMYKLRLRPRVRPRRDHRPGKKPSRIPTPLSYRDCGPMEEPGGAMTNTPSVTHRQAQPPSSHTQAQPPSSHTQAQPPSSHTQAQPPSSHTQAQPPSSVKGYGQVHCCRQPGGFECAKRLEQSHMSSQETAGGPEQESWV